MGNFIGPNVHEDIENAQKAIKAIGYNKILFKHRMDKTTRIIKLKKHKFMKKFRKVK